MDDEFITIGEAARLLKQADSAVMRLIKEALQAGIEKENITKAEMRQGRMMYLVSRTFLIEESAREKARAALKGDEPPAKDEALSEERRPEYSGSGEQSQNLRESLSGDVLSVKNDMISILQKVIDTKDQQIGDLSGKIDQLIERDHETNILLKGLQDRLFLLEEGSLTEATKKKRK